MHWMLQTPPAEILLPIKSIMAAAPQWRLAELGNKRPKYPSWGHILLSVSFWYTFLVPFCFFLQKKPCYFYLISECIYKMRLFGRVYGTMQFCYVPIQRYVWLDYFRPAHAKELCKACVSDIAWSELTWPKAVFIYS